MPANNSHDNTLREPRSSGDSPDVLFGIVV